MATFNARVMQKIDTTAAWEQVKTTFVPMKGEIVIYSDYETREVNGSQVIIPNMKIGNGNAYLADLPFVDEGLRAQINAHILNQSIHITDAERTFWNNKVRCYIDTSDIDECLIFTID